MHTNWLSHPSKSMINPEASFPCLLLLAFDGMQYLGFRVQDWIWLMGLVSIPTTIIKKLRNHGPTSLWTSLPMDHSYRLFLKAGWQFVSKHCFAFVFFAAFICWYEMASIGRVSWRYCCSIPSQTFSKQTHDDSNQTKDTFQVKSETVETLVSGLHAPIWQDKAIKKKARQASKLLILPGP